jgi:hypothetical protein
MPNTLNELIADQPDTAQGALAMLAELSSLDLTDANAIPDPWVHGVWKVTTPRDKFTNYAIIYMEQKDFECSDRF